MPACHFRSREAASAGQRSRTKSQTERKKERCASAHRSCALAHSLRAFESDFAARREKRKSRRAHLLSFFLCLWAPECVSVAQKTRTHIQQNGNDCQRAQGNPPRRGSTRGAFSCGFYRFSRVFTAPTRRHLKVCMCAKWDARAPARLYNVSPLALFFPAHTG